MAERTLPGLGLTGFWPLGADGWKDEMDANLRLLSAVAQLSVISRTTNLPGSPSDGDIYIVPDAAPEFGGQIAIRDAGAWVYVPPTNGMRAWVQDDAEVVIRSGASWISQTDTGTFTDSLFTLQDDGNNTRKMRFQLSGISAGQTRTLTVPNLSGTIMLTDQTQTVSGALTFSNTTMTFAAATTANIATATTATTVNLGSGGTTTGVSKTLNLGTGGASGSTTTINIGSATAGALGATNLNSPTVTFGTTNTQITIAGTTTLTASSTNASFERVGIGGATADATNQLSVNTPSVLFNRGTDTINVTLNKQAAGNDARFTFQTNFSTRALFGTLASDDFALQTSPNGSSFNTAFIARAADGDITDMSVRANTFSIRDNTDRTKVAQFVISGFTTGTTRSFTLPNASDTVAVLGQTQTFTGAITFSAGTLTISGTTLTASTLTTVNLAVATTATTVNIGSGATADTVSKTINLGTGGASGSTTNINVGTSAAGRLGTTTINGVTISLTGPTGADSTINIGGQNNASGITQTINVATSGVSGSITNINIGPDAAGRLGTTSLHSQTVIFSGRVTTIQIVGSTVLDATSTDARLNFVGVGGATADSNNRISANTPSVLFNRATDTINVTLNKQAAGNDARFTFQTNFSTRALFGTLANDDFTIKVSPNGSTFYDAIQIDRNSGSVEFPAPIVLPGLASPPSPPASGKIAVYARDRAGAAWLEIMRPSGRLFPLQPHFGVNRIGMWAPSTSNTVTVWGMPRTGVGTISTPTLATTDLSTSIRRWRNTSAATAGAAAEERSAGWVCWRGNAAGRGGWTYVNRISMVTLQATGMAFFGLYGATNALATTLLLNEVVNCVGIGFQRGTHTNWQIVHNSNSGTPTYIDLGASFPVTSTTNVLTLFIYSAPNGSSIWVRVVEEVSDTVAEFEITTNMPANTQLLSPRNYMNNGATAAAVAYDCSGVYIETDY